MDTLYVQSVRTRKSWMLQYTPLSSNIVGEVPPRDSKERWKFSVSIFVPVEGRGFITNVRLDFQRIEKKKKECNTLIIYIDSPFPSFFLFNFSKHVIFSFRFSLFSQSKCFILKEVIRLPMWRQMCRNWRHWLLKLPPWVRTCSRYVLYRRVKSLSVYTRNDDFHATALLQHTRIRCEHRSRNLNKDAFKRTSTRYVNKLIFETY